MEEIIKFCQERKLDMNISVNYYSQSNTIEFVLQVNKTEILVKSSEAVFPIQFESFATEAMMNLNNPEIMKKIETKTDENLFESATDFIYNPSNIKQETEMVMDLDMNEDDKKEEMQMKQEDEEKKEEHIMENID